MALFYVSVICLYQMKKILLIIMLFLLCACTGGSTETMENRILEPDKTDEEEICSFIAENYESSSGFLIGTGIITLNEDDEQQLGIYPIYEGDRLIALAVKDKTFRYITNESLLSCIKDDGAYLIVGEGSNIIYVDQDKAVLLDGREGCLEEKETEEMIKRIKLSIGEKNPMGTEKKKLNVNKAGNNMTKDGRYRNDRIIVSFKDGHAEKMIADFEAFCGGKAQSDVNTSNIYIFVFDPLNDSDLYALLEKSRNLDYVSGASLDQKHETSGISDTKVSE